MVINQVHVHRLSLDKAEDNAPVARDAHAPLPAPVALQRMQPVARQFHVLGRLRRRQFRQDYDGYGGSGVAAPVGHRPARLVVAVLMCAHLMQRNMAQRHALLQVLRPQADCRAVPSDRPVGLLLSR